MNLAYKEVIINQIQLLFPSMPFFKFNRDEWEKKNKQYLDCIRVIENSDSVKAIPIEKVKQAREEIANSMPSYTSREQLEGGDPVFHAVCECVADDLAILDKLIAESEG